MWKYARRRKHIEDVLVVPGLCYSMSRHMSPQLLLPLLLLPMSKANIYIVVLASVPGISSVETCLVHEFAEERQQALEILFQLSSAFYKYIDFGLCITHMAYTF